MGLLITTDIWNWSELCKSLLNSEFICSKAEFWEIVHALFLLLLVQLDLGDLRLQIGEFCIEAACVPISSQIRNKRGFHFTLQKIMINLPDYFLASDKCLYNLLWQTVDNLFDLLKKFPAGFCKIEMLLHTKSSIFSSKPLFWILGRKMWDVQTYFIQFNSRISDLDKKIADESPTLFWKRLRKTK